MPVITSRDALLIVDVQNDFLPGGALAVPDGQAVIPPINRLMRLPFGVVVATQDWHPLNHESFLTAIPPGPWPVHCVAGSDGAALADELDTAPIGMIVRKGRNPAIDSYSAFVDNARDMRTGLASCLRELGIARVFVTGLALDYCVAATARDAVAAGFDCRVVVDACRGIGDAADTIRQLHKDGLVTVTTVALA